MASFAPVLYSVGTTAVKILSARNNRTSWNVIFPSTSKVAANTGNVWVGIDTVPNATAGNTQSGHMMANGEQFGESSNYPNDNVSQGDVYAIASTSGQIIEVYEVVQ